MMHKETQRPINKHIVTPLCVCEQVKSEAESWKTNKAQLRQMS